MAEKVLGSPENPEKFMNAVISSVGNDGVFLMIGANTMDPKTNHDDVNDPLRSIIDRIPNWNKYFVEPIPDLFKKLVNNVKVWPNATPINVALSVNQASLDAAEFVPMYCPPGALEDNYIEKNKLPVFANQVCSFSKDHVAKHFPSIPVQDFTVVNVTAMSFPLLMKKYNMEHVRILYIDAEGFDFEVLKLFPLHAFRPNFISWEHGHLSADDVDAAELYARSHCYAVWKSGINTYAFAMH